MDKIAEFLSAAGRTAGDCYLRIETADRRFDPLTRNVTVLLLSRGAPDDVIERWSGPIEALAAAMTGGNLVAGLPAGRW